MNENENQQEEIIDFNEPQPDVEDDKAHFSSINNVDKEPQPAINAEDEKETEKSAEESGKASNNEEENAKLERALRKINKYKNEKNQLSKKLQELEQRNRELENFGTMSDKAAMLHYEKSVDLQMEKAKRLQMMAIESGDVEQQSEAAIEVAKAVAEKQRLDSYKNQQKINNDSNASQQQSKNVQPAQEQVEIDPNIMEWVNANPWYDQSSDEYDEDKAREVAAYAQALEIKLVRTGQQKKIGTKEYFNAIDQYVNDNFQMDAPMNQPIKRSSPAFSKVAPVSKPTSSGPIRVNLSDNQREIAQNFGFTDKEYEDAVIDRLKQNKRNKS